ncbi:MAG: DNA polymerase III subunit delta [Candidatus Paceibacterota bacterium]
MIIFLYGSDSYRLKQNIDKIVAEYDKKNVSGINFSVLDFAESDQLNKLSDLIKTVSFFEEKRLVVIKGSFPSGKPVADLIKKWRLASDKQIILVFAESSDEKELAKKDKVLFKLLSDKDNVVKHFEPLSGKQLEAWVNKEMKDGELGIDPAALKRLISYTSSPTTRSGSADSSNTWRLKQEIDKLISYKSSNPKDGQMITEQDVDLLVSPNEDQNIFEAVDAMASKNKFRAAATLYEHLESGTDPYYIFSMVVYQFRNLLKVKDLANSAIPYSNIARKTGLNPYVVKKTYEQCKKFDLDELKRFFASLAQIEMDVKSGNADMADELYRLAFSMNT